MTQMDLSLKQKQPHRYRDQICGCQGEEGGGRSTGSLGLTDANYYTQNG